MRSDRPDPIRVARRYLLATSCSVVTGAERQEYLASVWEMYETTYRTIGMHVANPQAMMKYDQWEICKNDEGNPVQFTLFTRTPHGLKGGLSGHDGSSSGKRFAIEKLRSRFTTPGFFGEVSHKVKDIALGAGAPAVCSAYVPEVIRKPIKPLANGLEYQRDLPGLGKVTKMLVGKPRGVATTNPKNPTCPVVRQSSVDSFEDGEDICGLGAHYACLAYDQLL